MKKLFTSLLLLTLMAGAARAQLMYQPYSNQVYQKLNAQVYSTSTNLHTSAKPFLISDSSALRPAYNHLLELDVDNSQKSWLNHLLFTGHLAQVNTKDYTFYLDYLPDLQLG